MATKVESEESLEALLEELIRIDYNALGAYRGAIDRLAQESLRSALGEFAEDHLRHTRELGEMLSAMGRTPPQGGDAKRLLAQGKVAVGGLFGDKAVLWAVLWAMRSNEDNTNAVYERALRSRDVSPTALGALERARENERRHREWIISALKAK